MSKLSLVLLAAGMGSRYGALKQMDEFGPNGETIMDYSIYDAIHAGFDHIVFIIRESFQEAFEEKFSNRFGKDIKVEFVTQELDKATGDFVVPDYREKPWGTGHALLMVKEVVNGPFAVINADDYYGKEAFKTLADYLNNSPNEFCIVAYQLANTLSKHGTVNRGLCILDEEGNLQDVIETLSIGYDDEGTIVYPSNGDEYKTLDGDTKVSMNMFGFTPEFFTLAESQFKDFLKERGQEPKSEFYIPQVLDHEIKKNGLNVRVLNSPSKWFGVTYKEDKPAVESSIQELISKGVYPENLWE